MVAKSSMLHIYFINRLKLMQTIVLVLAHKHLITKLIINIQAHSYTGAYACIYVYMIPTNSLCMCIRRSMVNTKQQNWTYSCHGSVLNLNMLAYYRISLCNKVYTACRPYIVHDLQWVVPVSNFHSNIISFLHLQMNQSDLSTNTRCPKW